MATMLEQFTIKEQRSVVRFLWEKRLNAKDVYRETFPVYGNQYDRTNSKQPHSFIGNHTIYSIGAEG
jgi:hypothetical protein